MEGGTPLLTMPPVLPMLTLNSVWVVALAANVRFPCTDNGPAFPGWRRPSWSM